MLLHVLKLHGQFLVAIEGALSRSHHHQFIRYVKNGFQLLSLQFAKVAINLIIPHLLCIFLDLLNKVPIRYIKIAQAASSCLVVHEQVLPDHPQFLHFPLQLRVLGDVALIDEVELSLD